MKIVDSENKDKSVKFSELSCGDVFTFDGEVYLKSGYASEEYAVDLKTGIIRYMSHLQDINVTPLSNAELHLNK